VAAEEGDEFRPLHGADGGVVSQNGAAQGVLAPGVADEKLVNTVLGVVLAHLDLFEDDLALPLDLLRREGRVDQDVGKDIQPPLDMFGEDVQVEAGVLAPGEGVEVTADGIDFPGKDGSGPGRGALEEQVLNEVGTPAERRGLRAGTRSDPDAEGD
jgi:hypothetical protein